MGSREEHDYCLSPEETFGLDLRIYLSNYLSVKRFLSVCLHLETMCDYLFKKILLSVF